MKIALLEEPAPKNSPWPAEKEVGFVCLEKDWLGGSQGVWICVWDRRMCRAGRDRAAQAAGREESRGILRTPGLALLTKKCAKSWLTDGSGGEGVLEKGEVQEAAERQRRSVE